MSIAEEAMVFECAGARLVGVLHRPDVPQPRGVLIVVGGPQYRVGSHRQFVLLSREWASLGVPVLRFDYRGMGDSDDPPVGFEHAGPDIGAAIDAFYGAVPQLREVVIWGLCDAASAALMYASRDPRVCGLVLLNPWVRREKSEARTYLRHYYVGRLLNREQWKRFLMGKVNVLASAGEFLRIVRRSVAQHAPGVSSKAESFVERMLEGLESFHGRAMFILCGEDLTAAEFKGEVRRSKQWSRAMRRPTIEVRELPEANHTFSRAEWRARVAQWTSEWLRSW
jgi:exosortase A-associated hydrolase 1